MWELQQVFNTNSCAKYGDSASVSIASVIWTYDVDTKSASEENWKKPSLTVSLKASFNGDSNE